MGVWNLIFGTSEHKKEWEQKKKVIRDLNKIIEKEKNIKECLSNNFKSELETFCNQRLAIENKKLLDANYKSDYSNMEDSSEKLNNSLKNAISSMSKKKSELESKLSVYNQAQTLLTDLQVYVERKYNKAIQQGLEMANQQMKEGLKTGKFIGDDE